MPEKDTHKIYDLCVIGGGINGSGIARDAAGRGLSVLLIEAGDLGSATSSSSTKLIHGGLRYLEHFEFKLVREALKEREVLWRLAPHIIWPLDFVLPHDHKQRPFWLIRLGLFLYDHLAVRRFLKASSSLLWGDVNRNNNQDSKSKLRDEKKNKETGHHEESLRGLRDQRDERNKRDKSGLQKHCLKSLIPRFWRGFVYSDCWVEDSRLVILNAMDARQRGADIKTYTACTKLALDENKQWVVTCKTLGALGQVLQKEQALEDVFKAKMVVNAAGPWVRGLLEGSGLAGEDVPKITLVKGSHIIVPRILEGDHAYLLQQEDGRIVFAIPYEGRFTLVGTTEEKFLGDPVGAKISKEEIQYLVDAYNSFFIEKIALKDVVWSYSGVRPLFDDRQVRAPGSKGISSLLPLCLPGCWKRGGIDGKGQGEQASKNKYSKVSRGYYLHHHKEQAAPLISVFGGKLTTYRMLAEKAVNLLLFLKAKGGAAWTRAHALPGGKIESNVGAVTKRSFSNFVERQNTRFSFMPRDLLYRYARAYGQRMDEILAGASSLEDLGTDFGDGVYEAEIRYLIVYEWAQSLEDILWRRSKLGLHISAKTLQNLEKSFPKLLKACIS